MTQIARTPADVRNRCRKVFLKAGIAFNPFTHVPVFDYPTAAIVRQLFKLHGKETKCLFLKSKKQEYFMFVSLEEVRVDWARAKAALGTKVTLASEAELRAETGCLPACAVPLGLPEHVSLLVDRTLEEQAALIFSPGPPTETVEVDGRAWPRLLTAATNRIFGY